MFDIEKIKTLNNIEWVVYQFSIENSDKIVNMTIRELSDACHVSTSSILRCCNKLGFSGYSEFRYAFKQELSKQNNQNFDNFFSSTIHINSFLKKINEEDYRKTLEPAVALITSSRHLAFCGIGTSGIMGDYASRYFTNMEMNAYSITDPFYPIPPRGLENTLAIILSVSGETKEMIEKAEDFKRFGAKVLSITNDEKSTIAKMANYNLSYYMPEINSLDERYLNLTTQIPVITLIELLAHESFKLLNENK